jgi:hypothetical protein
VSAWCRSCGAGGQAGAACERCGAGLDLDAPAAGWVGLTFELPGRLRGRRVGICVGESAAGVEVHVSPKEPAVVVAPSTLATPAPGPASSLSAAARLLAAARRPADTPGQQWDPGILAAKGWAHANRSMGARRRLHDEAARLGWTDVVGAVPLTESERAWRRAHDAAVAGRVPELRGALAALPAEGYAARVELALPFAEAIAADAAWAPLLASWVQLALPGAAELAALTGAADWAGAMAAGAALLAPDRAEAWREATASFERGAVPAPVAPTPGWWATAAAWSRAVAGEPVADDLRLVAALELPLLEDLVDAGALDGSQVVQVPDATSRVTLLARLDPALLSDERLVEVGHVDEVARRCFLRRDRTAVDRLPSSPGVEHYAGLLELVDGGALDRERVRPETAAALEVVERARDAVRDGRTAIVPAPVLNDPTTWRLFEDDARTGRLAPDAELRASNPSFSQWCDLQRLLGLVWEARWQDAVDLGSSLLPSLSEERYADEAANLVAFGLTQLGQDGRAVELLEQALAGSYTEALLVNTSIVAARVGVDVAAPVMARLVREAPSPELQCAAMLRAVRVWDEAHGRAFPPELLGPLELALRSDCSLADYVPLVRVAVRVGADVLLRLPEPPGEKAGPFRLALARVRFDRAQDGGHRELADAYVAVGREFGRTEWFEDEWSRLRAQLRDSVYVDFGRAVGSAIFIDAVLQAWPELFPERDRMLLASQAGAHLANAVDSPLSNEALSRFFIGPIDQFLQREPELDQVEARAVAENFHRTLASAGVAFVVHAERQMEEPAGQLLARLEQQPAHRLAIGVELRRVIERAEQCMHTVDVLVDRLGRLESRAATPEAVGRTAAITTRLQTWRQRAAALRARV